MDKNTQIWRQFYRKSITKPHLPRTECVVELNESDCYVAIDCGCGTGSDIAHLASLGYQTHGFDINTDAISICTQRFKNEPLVTISQAAFENFEYPTTGAILAYSSLFFAEPDCFSKTWLSITSTLVIGGVFIGDFMGEQDSWAGTYRTSTAPLTKHQVTELFMNFEIINFYERKEFGKTSLGKIKKWHTFSVIAVKRS